MQHARKLSLHKKSKMAKKKKQKEKIIYSDDNSTIADMTNVTRTGKPRKQSNVPPPTESKWKTFWRAFRMMLIPTAVVLLVMAIGALILLLLVR